MIFDGESPSCSLDFFIFILTDDGFIAVEISFLGVPASSREDL